jgi:hypothetical protein
MELVCVARQVQQGQKKANSDILQAVTGSEAA